MAVTRQLHDLHGGYMWEMLTIDTYGIHLTLTQAPGPIRVRRWPPEGVGQSPGGLSEGGCSCLLIGFYKLFINTVFINTPLPADFRKQT